MLRFANDLDLVISAFFTENESGATLQSPELFRLLEIAQKDDDWDSLKSIIKAKGLRVVSLDLPTSHQFAVVNDEFTGRMLSAIARKDDEDRRRRKEGIIKARPEDCSRSKISKVSKRLKQNNMKPHI